MATEIGKTAFPGGTWGLAPDAHVLGQVAVSVAGTVSSSRAWMRRDVTGATTIQCRMGVYLESGGLPSGAPLGSSNTLTLNDAIAPQNSWVQQVFTWGTPSSSLPGSGNVVIVLQYGPTGASSQMGATAAEGGGLEWDGATFASGMPASLTAGATVRTNSFPISVIVDPPVGVAGKGRSLLMGVG